MAIKKDVKEFKRLYNNLVELFRRIYADTTKYPKGTCADWFVCDLHNLLIEDRLKAQLTEEHINHILEMSLNLRRTTLISNESKKELTNNMKELRIIKKNLAETVLAK